MGQVKIQGRYSLTKSVLLILFLFHSILVILNRRLCPFPDPARCKHND